MKIQSNNYRWRTITLIPNFSLLFFHIPTHFAITVKDMIATREWALIHTGDPDVQFIMKFTHVVWEILTF